MKDPLNDPPEELAKQLHDFAEAANKEIGRLQGEVRQLDKRLDDASLRIDLILESILRAGLPVSKKGLDLVGRTSTGRPKTKPKQ